MTDAAATSFLRSSLRLASQRRHGLRRRLYLQIYLVLVGALLLFAVASSVVWWLMPRDREAEQFLSGMAMIVSQSLPHAAQPPEVQQAALERLARTFSADLTLYDHNWELLARVGPKLAPPSRLRGGGESGSGIGHSSDRGMVAVLRLADGRRLLADRAGDQHKHHPLGAIAMLALLAGTLAIASWPLAKRLTRRLERLRAGVEGLGGGDLRARVAVEGRDEIADLAESFNLAAERIEKLVYAQKDALATASHELRSPLARMRVAIELLGPGSRPEVQERIARDIDELDELIGEILLASRLDASPQLERREEVELLALVAEEASRVGAEVSGEALTLRGDARLLRRLARNLFENARRYGGGSPVEASVSRSTDGAVLLRVSDRGPGIPLAERERIFEAFYRRSGTSEGDGGGVGLGLALVRRIAESHGGRVRALARGGGGTTMEVELPGSD